MTPRDRARAKIAQAFRERIEQGISALPPEKAAELVALLEASIRRRKIELFGYIASAVVLLLGMVIAVYVYGRAAHGGRHRAAGVPLRERRRDRAT